MIEGMADRKTRSRNKLSTRPAAAVEKTGEKRDRRLANPPRVERTWCDDHDAQLAALRVVLQMPRVLASRSREETT